VLPAGACAWRFIGLAASLLLAACLLTVAPVRLHAQAGGTQPYTVQAGETLSEIAATFGVNADALLELNGIADANAIYSGQILLVPAEASTSLDPADEPATLEPVPDGTLPDIHRLLPDQPATQPGKAGQGGRQRAHGRCRGDWLA